MDPNAALSEYWESVLSGDKSGAREAKSNLMGWLRGGGFEPNWAGSGFTREEFFKGRKRKKAERTVTAADILGESKRSVSLGKFLGPGRRR